MLNLAYNSVRKKVAFGLLELYEKYRDDNTLGTLEISRENMASTIGVAIESLIRTLKEFKTEELIDITNGKVVITNEAKLKILSY
jgi:CRP-like cAMP-binding protein